MAMELVKIRNTHDTKDLPLNHDELGHITVPAGEEVIVPLAYLVVCFGHPSARNVGVNRAREDEYKQALTWWGMYPGMNEDDWDDLRPSFEAYTMDDERIWTVLEDPEGTRGPLKTASPGEVSTNTVQGEIEDLQAQIDQLKRIASVNQAINPPTPEASPLPDNADEGLPTAHDLGIGVEGTDVKGETQSERNEQRDELPTPAKKEVTKDGPKSRTKKS